jgi:PLP dependent protein
MSSITDKLQHVRCRIEAACAAAQRPVQSVTLLAVSKTQTAAAIREACAAGQHDFGENYVQEALRKQLELADLRAVRRRATPEADQPPRGAVIAASVGAPVLRWHLIGPLQSNKTREVAEHFDWVHTIDRAKVAQRLSDQRPVDLAPLQVCIQVNSSGEASKSGVAPGEVEALARMVAALPRLELRGLMSIPEPSDDAAVQRAQHRRLRELLESLRSGGLAVDTLSMGMSADLEAAVAEGSTLVRVGTAIFGERG